MNFDNLGYLSSILSEYLLFIYLLAIISIVHLVPNFKSANYKLIFDNSGYLSAIIYN